RTWRENFAWNLLNNFCGYGNSPFRKCARGAAVVQSRTAKFAAAGNRTRRQGNVARRLDKARRRKRCDCARQTTFRFARKFAQSRLSSSQQGIHARIERGEA